MGLCDPRVRYCRNRYGSPTSSLHRDAWCAEKPSKRSACPAPISLWTFSISNIVCECGLATTKLLLSLNASFPHQLGDAKIIRVGGRHHIWSQHAPWREYYMSRNLTYSCFRLFPTAKTKRFAALQLFRHAGAIVLFGAKRTACLGKIFQGAFDGWRGRLGPRCLPPLEA